MKDYTIYWNKCWEEEAPEELYKYLDMYRDMNSNEMEIFRTYGIKKVCDAACGFGAYTLAFASNGFDVFSFDISERAVEITKQGLKKYAIESANVRVASIIDTGYETECFDGVIAHAVMDHLTYEDASKALTELLRITRKEGLLMLTFDIAEAEDLEEEHILHEDGTMEYTLGSRAGMLFLPYDWEKIEKFLEGYEVIHRAEKGSRERVVIVKK